MTEVTIGNRKIGNDTPCYIVAEIGINHNGDLSLARKLIAAAKEAGVDAVKFQKRTVETVYTKAELDMPRESPFGNTNRALKEGLEFNQAEYEQIDAYCKSLYMPWFASCWDEASVDFIEQFNPPCYKIASASLTDRQLLTHIKNTRKPIILGCGMTEAHELATAVDILGTENLIILHACSAYPAAIEDIHLNTIHTLHNLYPNAVVGYSGHETDIVVSCAAVAIGARVVERHLTLDRQLWGSDQKASIDPHQLSQLVTNIRIVETAMGQSDIKCLESEKPVRQKLRRKYF